jgi:FG-GAP-like repeat
LLANGQSATRIWALAETRDPFANYISYTYTPADDNGFLTIASISYGGNRTLDMDHQRKITFSYETRTDTRVEFVGGSSAKLDQRLASISSSFGGNLVHTHTFGYDYAPVTGVSRLQTVTLSDSSGASVSPLTFNWSDCVTSVFDQSVALDSIDTASSSFQIIPVDVTGSGTTDLILASEDQANQLRLDIYLSNGTGKISTTARSDSGSTSLSYPYQLLPLDANGDGRTDLVRFIILYARSSI